MSDFNGDSANIFYCSVIDFVHGSKLKPHNKLRLLTSLLDSIDFWLLYVLSKEVFDKSLPISTSNSIGKILSYISSDQSFEIELDKTDVRISYEAVFLLLIRSDRKEVEIIADKIPGSFAAKALSGNELFKKLYGFENKFLRGDAALFRYAMAAWDRKSEYYKECISEIEKYIAVIKEKRTIDVLQDWKISRDTFASNSNVMESLTKGFKRLGDKNNVRSLKLVKFLKDLNIERIEAEPVGIRESSLRTNTIPPRPPRYDGMDNIILVGPPGTGKTYLANREGGDCRKTFIQFHPSYTYENFVQGERLIVLGKDRFSQVMDGPLMIAFRRATNTPIRSKAIVDSVSEKDGISLSLPPALLSKYLIPVGSEVHVNATGTEPWHTCSRTSENKIRAPFAAIANIGPGEILELYVKDPAWADMRREAIVIDEINRAEVAKVFGELLKAISEKEDHESETEVRLQYSGETFFWPGNLRIIATMNSADRSIGEMDLALKRRFKIIEISPDVGLFKKGQTFLYLEKLKDKLLSANDVDAIDGKILAIINHLGESIDGLVLLNNSLGEFYSLNEKSFQFLPLFSTSLEKLNELLLAEESIFNARKKLIGHSYFLKFARNLSEIITNFNGSGLLRNKECALEYTNVVRREYQSLLEHEIKPQIESICIENEKLVEKIMDNWLKSAIYVGPKEKKERDAESKAS